MSNKMGYRSKLLEYEGGCRKQPADNHTDGFNLLIGMNLLCLVLG